MSLAKITINAFNDYTNGAIFDTLTLPDGIDRDLVIDNIILEAGEFELVYSNPDFMKSAIGVWSDKYYRTFKKWIDALSIKYEPLENYDRMEEWEDKNISTHSGTNSSNTSGSASSTNNGTITNNSSDTMTGSVSAYDSDVFTPNEQNVGNGNSTSNSTGSTISNNNEYVTGSESTNDSSTNTREGRAHGNIGVTTSQQMLESELDIAKWNIYKHITDLFMQEFCIMVYI